MENNFFYELIQSLPVDFEDGPWIAGGFPLSVYRNDIHFNHDIDFFFKNEEQFNQYVEIFERVFNDGKEEKFNIEHLFSTAYKSKEFMVVKSENAYTFIPSSSFKNKVQFIKKKFYNSLDEVFADFDITVCRIFTDGVDFIASDETYNHIENNILHCQKVHEKSIRRFTKYVKYGFNPTKETVQAILELSNKITDFSNDGDDY